MTEQQKVVFTEDEIRPKEMAMAQQEFIDIDRNFLLSRMSEWCEVLCPACNSMDFKFFGEKRGFVYVECAKCGTVYTNPRPSQTLLHDLYANSQVYKYWNKYMFPASEHTRRVHIFRPRAERLADYCKTSGINCDTLLEVGAGFGIFCEEVSKLGLFKRIIVVEPTSDLAETCRLKGFDVMNMPVEDITESEFIDVLAAFEVIEHLFSPEQFLKQCFRMLRPGGLLFLTCPNVRGFDVATLRMLSTTFDHEHINYFHPKSLFMLLLNCGFDNINIQTPGQLDAEIVRKTVLDGKFEVNNHPFLREILLERWEELGNPFQKFLVGNKLSSHMSVFCKKIK
ncbi:MAG: class I SAM-dependent methyltransferase [Candidatus Eremiobacterota bacterium]